ncbi:MULTISPECIES: GNAT family N-acetyltransferase [unclassified Streptomyces]|uniref:GNAT family N-acetyltransferase n=1 Tax=unclassified Streptomyces TaxID=2593676 RepID=UPI0003664BBC|nr:MULTISPECIES: GNAT family N-acetyltransferase [unclassified Streptomyces]MYT27545.1 hypothetical protein [Streptomyces sp. SID8354]
MGISVEYDYDPTADVRLAEEAYAGLSDALPESDIDPADIESPACTVVARRDGSLLGWAQVYAVVDDEPAAFVQWLLVSRARGHATSGHNVLRDPTEEETDALVRLLRGAAEHARDAGYTALVWTDTDRSLDARAAAELGAPSAEDLGRHWTTTAPLADWRAPAGLPSVTTRRMPQPPGDALLSAYAALHTEATGRAVSPEEVPERPLDGPYPLLTLDLLTPQGELSAQVTAAIPGDGAFIGRVLHRKDVGDEQVTALLTELIAQLRRDHPQVTHLEVREVDDPVVARSLNSMGLQITGHWRSYRLPLQT